MKNNTSAVVSVKVVSDARNEEILSCFRTLHHITLQALTECEIPALFNTDFAKCVPEDYKILHQQGRALIGAKVKSAWDTYISDIKSKIEGVIDTHMNLAREDKSEWDCLSDRAKGRSPWSNVVKVPVSDLLPCFAEGKALSQVVVELDKLFSGKVGKGKDDAFYLSLAFTPAKVAEVSAEVVEAPTATIEAAAA